MHAKQRSVSGISSAATWQKEFELLGVLEQISGHIDSTGGSVTVFLTYRTLEPRSQGDTYESLSMSESKSFHCKTRQRKERKE